MAGELDSQLIAAGDTDPSAVLWFLVWWPHALTDGLNPLVSSQINPPGGYNLTWTTPMLAPSLLLAPVTAAFGPVVSYNVLGILSPAVSAFAGYALCRHLTGRAAPSLLAGYVFGFSPFVLGEARGHVLFLLLAMLPLVVLLVIRGMEGSIGTRRLVAGLTAALTFQFLTAVEVFAMGTVFGGAILVGLAVLAPSARAAVLRVARPLAAAYALTVVLVSPYLFYMLFRDHVEPTQADPDVFSSDALSFVVPTGLERLGRRQFAGAAATFDQIGGFGGSGVAYVGVPLLVIVLVFAVQRWSRLSTRVAVLSFAGIALAALGPRLRIANLETVWLPWEAITHLPLLGKALPYRFSAFMFLALAVILALWLSDRPSLGRWAAALAGVALLLPNLGQGKWETDIRTPAFFADGLHRRELSPRDRVLVVPYYGVGVRGHALADMRFKMAVAYLGAIPERDQIDPALNMIYTGRLRPGYPAAIRSFVDRHGITAIVVRAAEAPPLHPMFASLGGPAPREAGGVWVYRIRTAPAGS